MLDQLVSPGSFLFFFRESGGSFRSLAGIEGERVEREKRSEERSDRRLVKRLHNMVGEIREVQECERVT